MKYIALEELQKHIIHDGCDEGCGYIDERDLVTIPTVNFDKIRAEIEDIAFDWQEIDGEHESYMVVDLNDALNIIDKYTAEGSE